jgi:hypothetical protein
VKDVVRWKVTVEAVIGQTQLVHGQHVKLEDVWTGKEDSNGKPILEGKYGYAPNREQYVESQVKIFEQVVDTPIDMVRLVQVVNGVTQGANAS